MYARLAQAVEEVSEQPSALAFEDAADRKWAQARPWIVPGRVVDLGCATGAMLELAAREPALAESDLIGVEVAPELFAECEHKKSQGAFANPNTFFYRRNILAGSLFPDRSIATTLSFALTHEIYSYGDGMPSLEAFARAIADQTGGLADDVVGGLAHVDAQHPGAVCRAGRGATTAGA